MMRKLVIPMRQVAILVSLAALSACDNRQKTSSEEQYPEEYNTGRMTDQGPQRKPNSNQFETAQDITSSAPNRSPNPAKEQQMKVAPKMEELNKDVGHTGRSLRK